MDSIQVLGQLQHAGPVCHTAAGGGEPGEVFALHEGHESTATGLGLLSAPKRSKKRRRQPALHPGPQSGSHGPPPAEALPVLWNGSLGHCGATGREDSEITKMIFNIHRLVHTRLIRNYVSLQSSCNAFARPDHNIESL